MTIKLERHKTFLKLFRPLQSHPHRIEPDGVACDSLVSRLCHPARFEATGFGIALPMATQHGLLGASTAIGDKDRCRSSDARAGTIGALNETQCSGTIRDRPLSETNAHQGDAERGHDTVASKFEIHTPSSMLQLSAP